MLHLLIPEMLQYPQAVRTIVFFSWCPPSNPCNQGEAYEAPALVSQLIQLPQGETNEPLGQPENQAEGSEDPPEDPERIGVVRVPL